MKFKFVSSFVGINKISLASATDTGVIASYNSFSKSKINNTLTLEESSVLSRFSTSMSSRPVNAILIGQIDKLGKLVDADIQSSTAESSLISLNTDLNIDFS